MLLKTCDCTTYHNRQCRTDEVKHTLRHEITLVSPAVVKSSHAHNIPIIGVLNFSHWAFFFPVFSQDVWIKCVCVYSRRVQIHHCFYLCKLPKTRRQKAYQNSRDLFWATGQSIVPIVLESYWWELSLYMWSTIIPIVGKGRGHTLHSTKLVHQEN